MTAEAMAKAVELVQDLADRMGELQTELMTAAKDVADGTITPADGAKIVADANKELDELRSKIQRLNIPMLQ